MLSHAKTRASPRYPVTDCGLPFLRTEINFASAILSKTKQGSTLLEQTSGATLHTIDQRLPNSCCTGPQTLTMNELPCDYVGSAFKISRKENKESARFENFR